MEGILVPVSSKKVRKTGICNKNVIPVIKTMQIVSISRSVTTVPKDFANETLSYLARTPQRDTSPTRGNIRLVA